LNLLGDEYFRLFLGDLIRFDFFGLRFFLDLGLVLVR
jgi:hypothetical protein